MREEMGIYVGKYQIYISPSIIHKNQCKGSWMTTLVVFRVSSLSQ